MKTTDPKALLESGRRFCYYVDETMESHGGYVPSIVFEGVSGHFPMMGDPDRFQLPWVWGKTLESAKQMARMKNEELGISPMEANLIILSSMGAS